MMRIRAFWRAIQRTAIAAGTSIGLSARAVTEITRPYFKWVFLCWFPSHRASYLRDCWQYPWFEAGKDADASAVFDNEGSKPAVIFFPMSDWHTRIQRPQQMARAIAAIGHRVIFINPHLGCEYPRPWPLSRKPRIAVIAPRILELHIHLPREHPYHARLLSRTEARQVAAAVEEVVSALDVRNAIQIAGLPIWNDVCMAIRSSHGFPIVYDHHDLLSGFRNMARGIVEAQPALIGAADLVVCSSTYLLQSVRAAFPEVSARTILLRNAGAWEHFESLPPRRSERTIVGYVGAMDYWFDAEAILFAARSHPEWMFVLAGRIEDKNLYKLGLLPNVELRGEIPFALVPQTIATFSAAIIPFRVMPLTLATNPIKLYEYFSCGLPVVSSPLPEVEQFSHLVYIAETKEDFSRQLQRAVAERDPALEEERIQTARRENWAARAVSLLEALEVVHETPSSA